jgi:hypothetical protein
VAMAPSFFNLMFYWWRDGSRGPHAIALASSLTRMSPALTPSTPASAAPGSAPSRTSAFDQLVWPGRWRALRTPQTLIMRSTRSSASGPQC